MLYAIRRLALGVIAILLTSGVLLISDLGRRTPAAARVPSLAILQHASSPVLEDGVRGMIDGLAEAGFRDGTTLRIRRYNAEGDMAVGNAIAKQITTGEFDLVMTSSTPSMQAVANSNLDGRTKHIFGIVADPFSAGIGLDRANPLKHPPHMVGQSTFVPVDEVFALAKRSLPGLKAVGTAWNPAESNSRAFIFAAREVAKKMDLELIEANVDNTSGVAEAVQSVIARGAQALWIPGDNVMMAAHMTAIEVARRGRIPTFTLFPGKPDRGSIFDIGLDFHEVGRLAGALAARVLRGADMTTIPIRDVMDEVPRRVVINTLALRGLAEPWRIPDDALASANVLVDERGIHDRSAAKPGARRDTAPLGRTWNVDLIAYNNVTDVEEAEAGVLEGLGESGLVEGRDYRTRRRNAQNDMATVNSLVDAALLDGAHLLITFSTPTLQAAIQRARDVPVVFNYVASAVQAGAGKNDTDHLPNVTGVYHAAAYDDMIEVIKEVLPAARRFGTLYVPAEVNMVFHRDQMTRAMQRAGLETVVVAANTAAEVPDATLSLIDRRIDAICQLPGNLPAAAFPSIAQTARRAKLPVLGFQTSAAEAGAPIAVARDYRDAGRAAAHMAARIMRGESPASIPFAAARDTKLIINLEAAAAIGLRIPPALLARASRVIGS
jgi:ABC-type uncharacterized transport system substrate-binding protein